MPDISLLEPMVLRGVVEKFTVPETLVMLNRLNQTPWPYPSATWDVIKGSRMMAKPNVPNSEAHIVARLGRSQESASFVYLREKKVFEPTTLHWLRLPGQLAATNAEQAVLREINDLNQRFDNFMEWTVWQAMGGTLAFNFPDVQANINYKFPSSHIVTPGTPWVTLGATAYNTLGSAGATLSEDAGGGGSYAPTYASPFSIIEDIRAWKRLIQIHGRVPAQEVFATSVTMAALMEAWVNSGGGVAGGGSTTVNIPGIMLSDRMKDEYYSSGIISGFMGLTWNTVEQVYESDSGYLTFFVPDGTLYLGNYNDQRPIELLIGPTADDEAPDGFTGKFAKTWKDKDPSARQYLLEINFLPVVERPEQMLVATNIIANHGSG